MYQGNMCISPPNLLTSYRNYLPIMAISASGHCFVRIQRHHLSHVHQNPSHPIPITNEVIHISSNIRYFPSDLSPSKGLARETSHLVEKARQWEYINLTYLLKDLNSHDQLIAVIGHVLSVTDQKLHSSTRVSINMSPGLHHLYSCPSASKRNYPRRSNRPGCPQYLILQISNDLQGSQWPQYDQNFHE